MIRSVIGVILLLHCCITNAQIKINFQQNIPNSILKNVNVIKDEDYGKCAIINNDGINLDCSKWDFKDEITFSIWIKPEHLHDQPATIIGNNKNFFLRTLTNGSLHLFLEFVKQYDTPKILDANSWQHVAFTIDRHRKLTMFINGEIVLTDVIHHSFNLEFDSLVLGNDIYENNFKDKFNEVFVLDKALSVDSIVSMYNNTKMLPSLTRNLRAYYNLDGSGINRVSRKQSAINIETNIIIDGSRGSVTHFDGIHSHILFPNVEYDKQFSIATWAKVDTSHAGEDGWVALMGSNEFTLSISILEPKSFNFLFPLQKEFRIPIEKISFNEWNHFAVTIHLNRLMKFYVNGELIASKVPDVLPELDKEWMIGKSFWNKFFKGEMSEYLFWNRVLSDEEIKDIYLGRIKLNSSNSRAIYWSLLIIPFAFFILVWFKKRKNKNKLIRQIKKTPKQTINSIYILDKFSAFDKNGNEITSEFTPRLIQILSIILLYPIIHKNGIPSDTLSEMIWGEDDKKRNKLNRNSNIARLKKAIENIDFCDLVYRDRSWELDVQQECFIDIAALYEQFEKGSFIYGLDLSGQFCRELNMEGFDVFKNYFTNFFIDKLNKLLEPLHLSEQFLVVLELSNFWLSIDDLSKDAISYKISALKKLDRLREADQAFEKYSSTYYLVINEKINFDFNSLIK